MILVTGATGFVGRHLVRRLMAEGYPVRCLLPKRRQRRLPWDRRADNAPEIVIGSILDEEALYRAVTGVHVIIHLETAQWWGRPRDLERIDVVGTRTLIAAARSARVGRVMLVSPVGASPSAGFTLLRIKGMVEELIQGSGLAYTILRTPPLFGEDDRFFNHVAMTLAFSPFFFLMPGRGEILMNPLWVEDLVTALTRCLSRLSTVDRVIEIGGPEYMTFGEAVRTIMRVAHKRRSVVFIEPYIMRTILGLYRILFSRSLMTQQWLDVLASSRTARLGNLIELFEVHPQRFEDTLLGYLPRRWLYWQGLRYVLFRRRRREGQ